MTINKQAKAILDVIDKEVEEAEKTLFWYVRNNGGDNFVLLNRADRDYLYYLHTFMALRTVANKAHDAVGD